jgi:hypothetical protein
MWTKGETACNGFIGENEEKGEFGRPIRRFNDNIKLVLEDLQYHIKIILKEVLYEPWDPVRAASNASAPPLPPIIFRKIFKVKRKQMCRILRQNSLKIILLS